MKMSNNSESLSMDTEDDVMKISVFPLPSPSEEAYDESVHIFESTQFLSDAQISSERNKRKRNDDDDGDDTRLPKLLRREFDWIKQRSNPSMYKITHLPGTLLCSILLYLSSTEVMKTTRVNRFFRSTVLQEPETKAQLWRNTEMKLAVPQNMNDVMFCSVLDRIGADYIAVIDFGGYQSLLGDQSCEKIATHCSQSLKSLQRFYANGKSIGRVLSACKQLEHVNIVTSKPKALQTEQPPEQPVTQEQQQEQEQQQRQQGDEDEMVLETLTSLKRMEIQEAFLGDETILERCEQNIPPMTPNLQELNIRRRVILPSSIESVLRNCKKLQQLSLSAVLIFSVIQMFCASKCDLSHLESISLRGICEISDVDVPNAEPLPSVKRLAIINKKFKIEEIEVIAKYFPNITELKIGLFEHHVLSGVMLAISRHFKHVKRVVLVMNSPRFHKTIRMQCYYNLTIENIEIMEKDEPRPTPQQLPHNLVGSATTPTSVKSPFSANPTSQQLPTFTMQYLEAFMAAFPNLKTVHYNGRAYYDSEWMELKDGADKKQQGGSGGQRNRRVRKMFFEPLKKLIQTVRRLVSDTMNSGQVNDSRREIGLNGVTSTVATMLKTKALNEKVVHGIDPHAVHICTLSKFIIHVILNVEKKYEKFKTSQLMFNTAPCTPESAELDQSLYQLLVSLANVREQVDPMCANTPTTQPEGVNQVRNDDGAHNLSEVPQSNTPDDTTTINDLTSQEQRSRPSSIQERAQTPQPETQSQSQNQPQNQSKSQPQPQNQPQSHSYTHPHQQLLPSASTPSPTIPILQDYHILKPYFKAAHLIRRKFCKG